MTTPIALFLPIFTPTPEPEAELMAPPDMTMPEAAFLDEEPAIEGGDDGASIALARDEALAEAAIVTEAALAAQAAELEGRHAEALAEQRRLWVEEEGAALAALLRTAIADLEKAVAESLVEILQPVLGRAIRAKAAEELREAVTQLLNNGDAPMVRIGGPADLVEPLQAAFADKPGIEITATAAVEVSIEAGDTTIRTQLEAWARTLERHLGEVA